MFEGPVQSLIDELGKLPSIGPRTAQRIAFHLVAEGGEQAGRLQDALALVRHGVARCSVCGTISEGSLCRLCSDPKRELAIVCVVEESTDIQVIERTKEFHGRYHVLGGALDPLKGIGPDQLRVRELLTRVGGKVPDHEGNPTEIDITEVIIATDPDTNGEATAAYLARLLADFPGLVLSRPASGLPMGGELEFADELTLGRALIGRRTL